MNNGLDLDQTRGLSPPRNQAPLGQAPPGRWTPRCSEGMGARGSGSFISSSSDLQKSKLGTIQDWDRCRAVGVLKCRGCDLVGRDLAARLTLKLHRPDQQPLTEHLYHGNAFMHVCVRVCARANTQNAVEGCMLQTEHWSSQLRGIRIVKKTLVFSLYSEKCLYIS